MSNAAAAAVEARRNELMQLRSTVSQVQSDYKRTAETRIRQQKTMARLVQTVQERAVNDVPLVEDVIIVSLQSETAAAKSRTHIPDAPPPIDPNNQPSGRTSSAEEAMAVYQKQIETLNVDRTYRDALLQAETAMVKIYGQGIRDIVATVKEYCRDARLVQEVEGIASA
jgi:hypothetical protein